MGYSVMVGILLMAASAGASPADIRAEIDSLKAVQETIRAKIDSLKAAQTVLSEESSRIQQRVDSLGAALVPSVVRVRLTNGGTLHSHPDIMRKSSVQVPASAEVQVLGYRKGFFRVVYAGQEGYLSHYLFPQSTTLDTVVAAGMPPAEREAYWRKVGQKAAEDHRSAERSAELRTEWDRLMAERKARIERQYGKGTAARILKGQIWIGMTDDMARESRGVPHDVNRTVTAFGVHEQWVYGEEGYLLLYFDDGILTSWQN